MMNFSENNIEYNNKYNAEELNVNYNPGKDFTTLEAWKKARLIKLFFYREVISGLPDEEKHNLIIQIRKASISITANISERYGRYHYREGMQFYRISRASLYELKDHLISCSEFCYINNEIFNKGMALIEDAKITLNGYINFVKHQIDKTENAK